MSWGAYWMYYDCPDCGGHYRWALDSMTDPDFGRCPFCGAESIPAFESRDLSPEQAGNYAHYTIVE